MKNKNFFKKFCGLIVICAAICVLLFSCGENAEQNDTGTSGAPDSSGDLGNLSDENGELSETARLYPEV